MTHLSQALLLDTLLAGSFSPAVMLDAFLREAGASLNTVTSLDVLLQNDGGSTATIYILIEAITLLAIACPVLKSLSCNFCPIHLPGLSRSCPLLDTITFSCAEEDHEFLQQFLLLQPSGLPHLTRLELPHYAQQMGRCRLPDMSGAKSILILSMPRCTFDGATRWQLLPPQLEQLHISTLLETGPPILSEDRKGLGSLRVLLLEHVDEMPLHVLAQLLRGVPTLLDIQVVEAEGKQASVDCRLALSTAADLLTLHQRLEQSPGMKVIRDAVYYFDCSARASLRAVLPLIASLPRMTSLWKCSFEGCRLSEFTSWLRVFPNVRVLTLIYMDKMDDVALQDLATCTSLTGLRLSHCNKVTSLGVLGLCIRHAGLRSITCSHCPHLKQPALTRCAAVLKRQIQLTEVLGESDTGDEDA